MAKRSVYYRSFGGLDRYAKDAICAESAVDFVVDAGGSLCKSKGFENFIRSPAAIKACWAGTLCGRNAIVFLAGGNIYDCDPDNMTMTSEDASGASRAAFFKYEDKLYALCDTGYFRYDGSTFESATGYIPLISVSTAPDGEGTAYEAVNMLSSARRQQFSPNGTDACFHLAEKDISAVIKVTLGGEECAASDYSCDTANGTVTMTNIPDAGVNTLEITYDTGSSGRSDFCKFKNAMLFGSNADERVFLWNNPDRPCIRIHSELADGVPSAEYFPVTNYTSVGSAPITDMVQEYDRQLIFTADSAYYSYCEMKTMTSGKTVASFPVYPLHPRKGNLIYGSSCVMNGLAATLCRDGVNIWRPSTVENEKNAVCISGAVNDMILPETYAYATGAKLFELPSLSELYFVGATMTAVFNYATQKWYRLSAGGMTNVFEAFGSVFAVKGEYIKRMTSSERSGSASYKTHYSELGSCALKDVHFINLTVEAGYVTAGSVKVYWPGESGVFSSEQYFEVDQALHGNAVSVALPFYIPNVSGISVEFKCPPGKELKILGYGITFDDKGVNNGL
ncbi:MAG: hypothetical protein IJK33_10105 [Clostridia bacterium]|nr:hypothetical protein [Clostridia bacterium]MBQ6184221.1 hypothetical protein [Clostridia bacterium]